MKTNKSYRKRLKLTRNGKIVSRKPGQNHYNSKDSGRASLAKGRTVEVAMSNRDRRRFMVGI